MANAAAAQMAPRPSTQADEQHMTWLARSFGRGDYAPLGAQDLRTLIEVGAAVSLPPGAHLFREGEEVKAVLVIESGEVEVYRGSAATRRVIARTGPGSVLGDIAMFGGTPHICSAQAATRVRAHAVERDRLLPLLAKSPALGLRWLVAGIRQLEGTQRRVLRLMHKTVLGQVADLLVEEADGRGDVYLSQTTIATLLGVSRQSVNEALARLRDQGAVETGYRRIRVLDLERTRRVSVS